MARAFLVLLLGLLTAIFDTGPLPRVSMASVAQTTVGGIISEDTTWAVADSPFEVTGDVQVPTGVTLTIEPGGEVRFAGAYEILIKGAIIAKGTAENPITLTGTTGSSSAPPAPPPAPQSSSSRAPTWDSLISLTCAWTWLVRPSHRAGD